MALVARPKTIGIRERAYTAPATCAHEHGPFEGNDVMNRTIVGLLVICCAWGAAANAAQPATTTCDRECLRGKVTQLLYALLKHDVSSLPVAGTLRVTEDAVEKPLAKVGLVGTVTRLRGFRQDIIDERAGVAGADVVVEETGAPALLVVRLKVVADKLTEIELVATRGRAEGLIFNIDGLSAPSAVMNYAPRPEQLATRDEAIKAALHRGRERDAPAGDADALAHSYIPADALARTYIPAIATLEGGPPGPRLAPGPASCS